MLEYEMKDKRKAVKGAPVTVRASVSFPRVVYDELEKLAAAKKVSLAWIVRDAAERYVADQWPLFGRATDENR